MEMVAWQIRRVGPQAYVCPPGIARKPQGAVSSHRARQAGIMEFTVNPVNCCLRTDALSSVRALALSKTQLLWHQEGGSFMCCTPEFVKRDLCLQQMCGIGVSCLLFASCLNIASFTVSHSLFRTLLGVKWEKDLWKNQELEHSNRSNIRFFFQKHFFGLSLQLQNNISFVLVVKGIAVHAQT